jgi:hypothetical protein
MRKSLVLCTLAAIVAFCAGFLVCQNITVRENNELIDAYDSYNKHTEELLDTLDAQYDWVDAFDPHNYYESRAKLDSLFQEAN